MSDQDALPHLQRLGAALGISLDARALERFAGFRSLLLEWNQHTNLTRITDNEEIEIKLFADALALWPWFDRYRKRHPERTQLSIVDIGAGAGFPGLPLKIAHPEIELLLIEATGKKAVFIQAAIDRLDLAGTHVIHGRSEELAHQPELRSRFDVAIARAVARLPALIELCMPFCRAGGWGIFPKGKEARHEADEAKVALRRLKSRLLTVEPAPLPELAGTSIVVVEQMNPAPKEFPRRAGLPAKSPL